MPFKYLRRSVVLFFLVIFFWLSFSPAFAATDEFITLCYHDIPKEVKGDAYAVDQKTFVETIEYLLSHDYSFIGMEDILRAKKGEKALPEKAVFLTFDDGYQSFYDFVFPVLKKYEIPCLFAIVTEWLDKKPKKLKYDLISWEELKEVAKHPLVEVASHSHDLHQGVLYNPQGNEAAAATNRKYDVKTKKYETKKQHQARIYEDAKKAYDLLQIFKAT